MNESNEISLVDIFAVVLRYRKLIIGLPLILTAILGIYLYALPLAGVTKVKKEYLVQLSVTINQLPTDLKDRINVDIGQSLNAYFSSVPIQTIEYGKYFPKDLASLKDGELSTFIKKVLIEKKLEFALDAKESLYTISFKTDDQESGERYLSALWSGAANDVMNRLHSNYASALRLLDQGIKVFEDAKKLDAESLNGKAILVNEQQGIIALQSNPSFPFDKTPEDIVTIVNTGGRSKPMLVVFFASLLIALLGAFLLQAARNIKDDPESMDKIRAALDDGKRKP
jgi:hypothetical protein